MEKPSCILNVPQSLVEQDMSPGLETYLIARTSSPGLPLPLSTLLNHCGKTEEAIGPPQAKIDWPSIFL